MEMSASLLDKRPEVLVDEVDPADCLEALKGVNSLTPEQMEALDFALSHWVVVVLSRSKDRATLLLLDQLAARLGRLLGAGVADPSVEKSLPARLKVYRELMDTKALRIDSLESGRSSRLAHHQPILNLLRDGPVKQSTIVSKLGLTPGRVSQLLLVMEEGQQLTRERVGRENMVYPVSDAYDHEGTPRKPGRSPGRTERRGRGMIFFTPREAQLAPQ